MSRPKPPLPLERIKTMLLLMHGHWLRRMEIPRGFTLASANWYATREKRKRKVRP